MISSDMQEDMVMEALQRCRVAWAKVDPHLITAANYLDCLHLGFDHLPFSFV